MDPDDLLAIVVHDMRSPLNAIGLACEALDSDPSVEDRARYVAAIRRAAQRAERLLRDAVDLAQIERGELRLDRRQVSASGLVEQVRAVQAPIARDAGVELAVELPGDAGELFADSERLGQALGHLIGNAIKHARSSPIRLEVRPGVDDVELVVSDRGPGIAADALPHLFDRPVRGRRRDQRVGIGLAIVRGIAVAHGGTVTATSEPGQGARFAIRIPRRAAPGVGAR